MDHKDITIFLELVRCRNISKTAENLYLSQSAVSSRLKALEEEMGCQLVLRSKGQRSVELTRQGEEFISVAERWKLLLEETEAVKEKALSVVRIATNGSTYDRLLDEFLRQYTERHPEKKIQIKVCDSKDTYDLVSKELADFGFASYESLQGGLADCPVIAVPTSIGYGASFQGLSALLSMLNSCSSGVSVVNIDNGFGAGYLASMINHMEAKS